MLAKQSCRLMRNPNTPLYRVLRGRYFKDGDFLNASEVSFPSLTLRSMLWGRDLFKKGYRWKVGNGRLISIDSDPWLGKIGSATPSPIPRELRGLSISMFIKSAYHLISNHAFSKVASSSGLSPLRDRWKTFWNIDTIPRAKMCA